MCVHVCASKSKLDSSNCEDSVCHKLCSPCSQITQQEASSHLLTAVTVSGNEWHREKSPSVSSCPKQEEDGVSADYRLTAAWLPVQFTLILTCRLRGVVLCTWTKASRSLASSCSIRSDRTVSTHPSILFYVHTDTHI